MPALVDLTGFLGQNIAQQPRFLPAGVGTLSLNQKPSPAAEFEPWRVPLAVSGPPTLVASAITLYRMGRDTPSTSNYWLSWTTPVHVIRGFDGEDTTERTYFTGSGTPKVTDNTIALSGAPFPTTTRQFAVPQPDIAPVVTLDTDGATGDPRQNSYVYTWVNTWGWESAPSPPFLAPAAKPGATLDLDAPATVPAGNYHVDRIRWYRVEVTGENSAQFFFLREYGIAATGMMDDARALDEDSPLLTTAFLNLDDDASWLTTCWNQFVAAIVGKTVRTSQALYIYAFPLEGEYIMHSTPIALAAFAQRLLVLTTDGAEILTGTDWNSLDQKPLPLPVCVSPASLVVLDTTADSLTGGAMWATNDGLYYYGTDGQRNLTAAAMRPEQWRALVPSTMKGFVYKGLYVGFYNDGSGLKGIVVDPSNPAGVYPLATGYSAGYWDPLLRELFVLDGTTLKRWDQGATFMTGTYRGKLNRQPSTTEAEWLELLCKGTVAVKVWTDDPDADDEDDALLLRYDESITSGLHRLPDGAAGRDWQVEVATTGRVLGLAIE
jgi:hypothetical protein